jgi:hypothetical protein
MSSTPPPPAGLPASLRTGWSLHPLDDGALLAFPDPGKLIWLNGSAAWSFLRLAAGDDWAACSGELAARLGISPDDARRAVEDAVTSIEHALAVPESGFELALDVPDAPGDRPPTAAAAARYAVGGRGVRIACADSDDHMRVAAALPHLAVSEGRPAAGPDAEIHVPPGPGWVLLDGREGLARGGAGDLLPQLAQLLFVLWYRAQADFLAIHAGLVAHRGRGVLLPGSGGAGKTTAVAALLRLGATYHGDDFTVLGPSGTARAFPFPLTVKAANVAVLSGLFPELAKSPLHRRGDGVEVAYLVPERAADTGVEVDCIVFPRFRRGSRTVIREVGSGAALRWLAQEWSVVQLPEAERLDAFVAWLARVPAFELTYPDPDAAADGLTRILQKLRQP